MVAGDEDHPVGVGGHHQGGGHSETFQGGHLPGHRYITYQGSCIQGFRIFLLNMINMGGYRCSEGRIY